MQAGSFTVNGEIITAVGAGQAIRGVLDSVMADFYNEDFSEKTKLDTRYGLRFNFGEYSPQPLLSVHRMLL